MKKTSSKKIRKGFTLVELVIVIAIIAILAAVLIPTFSGIVRRANESAALQEAKNAFTEALAECLANDGAVTTTDTRTAPEPAITVTVVGAVVTIQFNGYTFTTDLNGKLTNAVLDNNSYTFEVTNGVITKATQASN